MVTRLRLDVCGPSRGAVDVMQDVCRVCAGAGCATIFYEAPIIRLPGMQGTTIRSVKYALGPQLGTLAFGSAVLTVADILRTAADQVQVLGF